MVCPLQLITPPESKIVLESTLEVTLSFCRKISFTQTAIHLQMVFVLQLANESRQFGKLVFSGIIIKSANSRQLKLNKVEMTIC